MKKTIVLILLLIPMLCFAGALQEKHRSVIAKKNVVSGSKTITHVNNDESYNTATENHSSIATDNAKSHTTGNTLVVIVYHHNGGYQAATRTVSTITDTAENTYTLLVRQSNDFNDVIEMWFATNITGNASNIVTATFSDTVDASNIHVLEFSGLGTATKDDDCGSTGTNAPSSCSVTTTSAVALLVAGITYAGGMSINPGSNYTETTTETYASSAEWQITSSTGTRNGDFTDFANGEWYSVQGALK